MRYDVAIVGAGPAGSRAAWRLARAGARVALVDGSHPREKPCGGGVTGRALAVVADQLGAAALPGVEVRTVTFAQDGTAATVSLDRGACGPHPALMVCAREQFDERLLSGAVAAGATHVERRAREVEVAREVRLVLQNGETIVAPVVIGADGPNSLVRRRVSRPFARAELSIAAGYFVRASPEARIDIEFEADPPGYLWSFPRPDHLAVGVCAQADSSSSRLLSEAARRWITRAGLSGRLEAYSWPIPSLPAHAVLAHTASGPGWMLAGDAAGLVDPITREGIYFALRSGDLAAEALLADGGGFVDRYRRGLAAEILPELRRAAHLKAGFFRPRFTKLLIRALQTSAPVRAIMADLVAGRQSYATLARRLMATLEVKLAWELFRLRRAS